VECAVSYIPLSTRNGELLTKAGKVMRDNLSAQISRTSAFTLATKAQQTVGNSLNIYRAAPDRSANSLSILWDGAAMRIAQWRNRSLFST
jgi:hypothetical protein